MKYRVEMPKSKVIGFIEEVQRRSGRILDIFIHNLDDLYVKRKRWAFLVDVERFEYPSTEWSEPGDLTLQGVEWKAWQD